MLTQHFEAHVEGDVKPPSPKVTPQLFTCRHAHCASQLGCGSRFPS